MVLSSTPGKAKLSSTRGAEPNAIVVIFNQNPALARDQRVTGTQADDTGTWSAEVIASPGDALDVSQEYGTTRSAPTRVQVPR